MQDGGGYHVINSRLGLVDDAVVALTADGEGRLWLMSDEGRIAIYPADVLAGMVAKPRDAAAD